MPFFSVVIPTWNRAPLLKQALDSVVSQRFTDFELIVADDGSVDNTAALSAAYGDRVHYLRQEHQGPGAARNLGLSAARGRYVTFLDSDDRWFTWTLAVFRAAILQHGEPAIVTGGHADFLNGASPALAETPMRTQAYQDYLATASDERWLHVNGTAIRRDGIADRIRFEGGDINSEDHDLWLRLGTTPGFVWIEDPPLFAYRRHPASRVGDLAKTVDGAQYLVRQEKAGVYPGGRARRRERLVILGRHLRPVVIACARAGRASDACALYREIFAWNLTLCRARFLLGAPVVMVKGRWSKSTR